MSLEYWITRSSAQLRTRRVMTIVCMFPEDITTEFV
jgi:hypothetical protein